MRRQRVALVVLVVGCGASEPDPELDDWRNTFIAKPDFGTEIVECNPFHQDCPAGEKCMPWARHGGTWDAAGCFPVADDPGAVGDPCTVEGSGRSGIDTCERGAMCWDVDPDTNAGECIAMCLGDESNPICADPFSTCRIYANGVPILCFPDCDPLAQGCPDGRACYAVGDHFACEPDISGDFGQAGDACEFLNVCDPGLLCLAPEHTGCPASVGCCTPLCSLETPTCPDGQTCIPWYEDGQAPPGQDDVGICSAQ